MNVRQMGQMAWRNLMRRKLRTWLTLLSIIIGVASTFAVISAVDSAKQAFPLYLKAAFGKADVQLNGTAGLFSDNVLHEAEHLPGAVAIAGLKSSTKLHVELNGISDLQKRVEVKGYSRLDSPLTNFQLIQGDLNSGGAVITERTAKGLKLGAGDTLSFDTDHGVREIPVAAVVKYTIELMGPSSWTMAKYHPWAVAVPLPIVQEWFDLPGKVDQVQLKAQDGQEVERLLQQADELAQRFNGIYSQPVVLDYEAHFQSADSFFLALYIAGCLGIALSAFIIFNTLYVSVKERRKEFATLKTIGYTAGQLQAIVLAEVLLLSIVGTALGLLLGYWMGVGLKSLVFQVYSVHDKGSFEWVQGLSISLLAGMLAPLAAALYPIRQAAKASVVETLRSNTASSKRRPKWPAAVGVGLILSAFFIKHLLVVVPFLLGVALLFPYLFGWIAAVLKPVYRKLGGFSGEMAGRNLTRNRSRTAMTSVMLCLGIAMIVLMSSLNSALLQTFEKVVYSSYGGNLDIMFHHTEPTDLERLKQIKGVADVRMYSLHNVIWTLNGKQRNLPVYGVGEDWIDRFPLFVTEGKSHGELIGSLGKNEILLDKVAFDVWGGELGGKISLDSPQGVREFTVEGVVSTMKNSGYGAFMKDTDFQDSFGLKYSHNALVLKDTETSPLQLRENIFGAFGERIESMFGPEDWVSMVGSVYTGSFGIINTLILLSIAISGLGITNTLLMNIMERVRELGMMRAVGVTRGQIIRMILLEGLGIGLAATVVGSLCGIALIYITSTFLEITSLTYRFEISWTIVGGIALFGLLISLLSSFTPASRAAKTHLSEALRYE